MARWTLTLSCMWLFTVAAGADDGSRVLATVDGEPVTQADLDTAFLIRRVPENRRDALRDALLDELIDRQVMANFLRSKKIEADPEEVSRNVSQLRRLIARGDRDPDEILARAGVTEDMLRRSLELPLAWSRWMRRITSDDQLRELFESQRQRFDGTKLRVSQIVVRVPADASEEARVAARDRLRSLRKRITAGEVSFADAAREFSESPSGASGGDLGWIVGSGRVTREVEDAARTLTVGEVSEPVASRSAWHLVTVTEQIPGQLSFEDVRGELLEELSQREWDRQLARSRADATIEVK